MLYIIAALFFSVVGVLLKGLMNLSIGELGVLLGIPVIFFYKLLGNRPSFLAIASWPIAICAGGAGIYAYFIVPMLYYYKLWGYFGIFIGIVAAILVPIEAILFLGVALFKGGAVLYICHFFAGISFAMAGLCLFNSTFTPSIWRTFTKSADSSIP